MTLPWEYVKDRASLKLRCEELLRELCYKAESVFSVPIAVMPQVVITTARKYYARILQEKAAIPIIRVNELFVRFYKADPILADYALKFALAHEVAHIVQRKIYGIGGLMFSHPLAVEEEANKFAERISEIEFEDFRDACYELHKKIGEYTISVEEMLS
jgi:hypothetical protein